MQGFITGVWGKKEPMYAMADAYETADAAALQPKKGFLGMMGERGIGGAKCGSTCVTCMMYESGGATKLVVANAVSKGWGGYWTQLPFK